MIIKKENRINAWKFFLYKMIKANESWRVDKTIITYERIKLITVIKWLCGLVTVA